MPERALSTGKSGHEEESLYNNCNLDDDRPPLLAILVGGYVDGENNGDNGQDLS